MLYTIMVESWENWSSPEMVIFSPFFIASSGLGLVRILYIGIILLRTIYGIQCPYMGIEQKEINKKGEKWWVIKNQGGWES